MQENIVELIRLTATSLAPEVLASLQTAKKGESPNSTAAAIYDELLDNAALAQNESLPLCQDSGIPLFKVKLPREESSQSFIRMLNQAVEKATELNYLRPNAVATLTNINSGTGVGRGIPQVEITSWDEPRIEVGLMLKGGGSENVGIQYSLPNSELNAERDLAGVANCVIDAVYRAQGRACPPYFIGVGIGGDRASSFKLAKDQFWRPLESSHPQLKEWEEEVLNKLNQLGIGPMGVGGKVTALSLKADSLDRIPASYFVSVAFTCWVFRRRWLRIEGSEINYA